MKIDRNSAEWKDSMWEKWPTSEEWPGTLDLHESAAYKRVSYNVLWHACQVGKDGKAELSHYRFGTAYRINKIDLDAFNLVLGRNSSRFVQVKP
jgi:hypothetical protein